MFALTLFPCSIKQTNSMEGGEKTPTSVAPPQLNQMTAVLRILLPNKNKTKQKYTGNE